LRRIPNPLSNLHELYEQESSMFSYLFSGIHEQFFSFMSDAIFHQPSIAGNAIWFVIYSTHIYSNLP
jgi:hypothetical protein